MSRILVAPLLAGSVALGLSACTAPTPEVTVWSGTASVMAPATCWAPESTVSDAIKSCITAAQANDGADLPTLSVTPGNVIGINVDPDVQAAGWVPSINKQPLAQAQLNQSYFRFTYPEAVETPATGFVLAVTARGGAGGTDRGIWLFRLVSSGTT